MGAPRLLGLTPSDSIPVRHRDVLAVAGDHVSPVGRPAFGSVPARE
ncbi:MAG TPA: hypothetical protein VLU06_07815 [Thermoanaerobaculia bacterium]|nr:hypothetical protein [Thermoanaerobaculia bacterium]